MNKAEDSVSRATAKSSLVRSGALLGLLQQDAESWLKGDVDESAEIEELIAKRLAARKEKNFAEADRIRNTLAIRGILLEDGPKGTTWRRAT